jgi:hypothetical protein
VELHAAALDRIAERAEVALSKAGSKAILTDFAVDKGAQLLLAQAL